MNENQEKEIDQPQPQPPDDPVEEILEAPEDDGLSNEERAKEISADLSNVVEAMVFASDQPLPVQTIRDVLKIELDAKEMRTIVLEINKRLQAERRPFEIVEVAGGYQFRTIAKYHKFLKGLFKDRAARRLSAQALETLAIIAYKQPVSKSEIEGIRNVSTDGAIKTLLEKQLVRVDRSEDKPGRPLVYSTTKNFLRYFGLNRLSDLPKLEEFEEIVKSQEQDLIHDFKREKESTTTLAADADATSFPEPAPKPVTEAVEPEEKKADEPLEETEELTQEEEDKLLEEQIEETADTQEIEAEEIGPEEGEAKK